MRHLTCGFLLASLLTTTGALGQDGGALPKGDEASPEKAGEGGDKAEAPKAEKAEKAEEGAEKGAERPAEKKEVEKPAEKKHRNCFLDLTEPPGGNGRFAADGKTLLLLAQTGEAREKKKEKGKKADSPNAKVRYTLLRINPKTRKSETLLSLDQRPNASLVTYGEPVEAVSAVAFGGRSAGCFEGPAAAVSVALDEDDAKPVHLSGMFQLVETPAGRQFVDLKKSAIVQLDTTSFQSKHARKIPSGDRPLWWDASKKLLVSWHDEGDQRGLVALSTEEKPKRLAFKPGDRVIQQGGRFAVLHLEPMANTLEIQEIPSWSKTEKAGKFTLQIPPAYAVATAAVSVNFDKHLALVFGANYLAKTKWQRVFVFNYETGKLLGAVPVTGTQYLNYAAFDPSGAYAVVEIRDMNSRQTVGAKVFNVAKKSFDDLDLGLSTK